MLAKAAVRTTLPETRPRRNHENAQSRVRCAARRRVLEDKRLTNGCARFYGILDEHYGWRNGLVCPKLRTLVLRFGLCRRSCQRWYAELREHGYLATEPSNGRACRHRLTWAQSVTSEAAGVSPHGLINEAEVNTELSAPVEASEPEMATEGGEVSECSRCGGTGEREYRHGGGRDSLGRLTPVRISRGPCGCQWFTDERARSATSGANAIMHDRAK